MSEPLPNYAPDDPQTVACYRRAMRKLRDAGVDFLIGGAYAFAHHTGIVRHTKDFDLFLRRRDRDFALETLAGAGFSTDVADEKWLAKAYWDQYFIDLIYNNGNCLSPVDDAWFAHAVPVELFGEPALLCPLEESIWSKAFVMERDRYDGADVAHLLLAAGARLDWRRLLDRFGEHWRVLYCHLILFGFIYPSERDRLPNWVLRELNRRLDEEIRSDPPAERICQGTLLAASQYSPDVERFGFADARDEPPAEASTDESAECNE